jgi:mercuric ion binding protein
MKKVILSIAVIAVMSLTSCKNDNKPKEETTTETTTEVTAEMATTAISFGVRGNCGMCKTTIEEAVNGVEGISKATWDKNKKKIAVSFDATKTDAMTIHKAIATSGYDTEKMAGNKEAYENLPGCCKYNHDMEMNIQ